MENHSNSKCETEGCQIKVLYENFAEEQTHSLEDKEEEEEMVLKFF